MKKKKNKMRLFVLDIRRIITTVTWLFSVLTFSTGQSTGTVFFQFTWDSAEGKIWLDVTDRWGEEFLYVNALSAGVGSNDLGLDRNQLGKDRIVKFERSGPTALLIEPNYRYRAVSENVKETQAVEEAFAKSVIWGFRIERRDGRDMVDLTPFLLRDAHGVSKVLAKAKQGNYKVDESRSAINPERTKGFPLNVEFDAYVTLVGKAEGGYIQSVTPDPDAVTVQMHHSFIELPDGEYTPREYDPRSGFIPMTYYDYATPIDQPLEKKLIVRHRLNKRDPDAAVSDPVEPIIYYLDRGCPEPIRSALIEGASWWNVAFEAAGYRNAFQVMDLPEGADPLDVRYNMINWVHRSTRGWSYGTSVVDPRTGEIIKGQVLLGSLRVRQDYLIAQGLAGDFDRDKDNSNVLLDMALQRLRQLSAHEVGHTIGLMHNFAASVNNRASVMDYPHPYVILENDSLRFDRAYGTGIGEWDKRAILFGYQDFPAGVDQDNALSKIIDETIEQGLYYVSDIDARPEGGAHPKGHLWDNGKDPITELDRLAEVRSFAIERFGEQNIPFGTPMAYLEQVLVPLYFSHRYQVEAVAKLIGGIDYTYALRGDGQRGPVVVDRERQVSATNALLKTLSTGFLKLDARYTSLIPPQPPGYDRHRELQSGYTNVVPDLLAVAEASAAHTLGLMLNPDRLARICRQSLYADQQLDLSEYLAHIDDYIRSNAKTSALEKGIALMIEKQFVIHLLHLAADRSVDRQVAASALLQLHILESRLDKELDQPDTAEITAHRYYLRHLIQEFENHPQSFQLPELADLPPGSPIGCGESTIEP